MIVALGESIVVIGVGATGLELDAGLVLVALETTKPSTEVNQGVTQRRAAASVQMIHCASPPRAPPRRTSLSLALSASLWWLYFSDEGRVERAMEEATPERRAELALSGFGYWHYGLILGVVALAAGLKKAIGDPYAELDGWIALELVGGVALFTACDAGFLRMMGIARSSLRLAAAAGALLTIPLGTELAAAAELGVLATLVALALVAEAVRPTGGP